MAVLRPDLIRAHYGAEVKILNDGAGGIVAVPVRSQGDTSDPNPGPVT